MKKTIKSQLQFKVLKDKPLETEIRITEAPSVFCDGSHSIEEKRGREKQSNLENFSKK